MKNRECGFRKVTAEDATEKIIRRDEGEAELSFQSIHPPPSLVRHPLLNHAAETLIAWGPLSPCSSMKTTSVPSLSLSKTGAMTLFR